MPIIQNIDNTQTGTASWTWSSGGGGSGTRIASQQRLYREGTGRRIKPKTPDVTAYRRSQRDVVVPFGKCRTKQVPYPSYTDYSGVHPDYGAIRLRAGFSDFSVTQNLKDDANVRALNKLNQRDLDLGTAWLERRKTYELLRTTAETLFDAFRAIRRGSGRDLLNSLGLDDARAVGEGIVYTNLAYNYGVRPLINDLNGAAQALARMRPETWSIRAKGAVRNESQISGLIRHDQGCRFSTTRVHAAKVVITARQRPLTREQDLLWALGLDNPIATLYEVTPYSFLVDQMISIGDWLSALNSIKYYSGWQSVSTRYLREKAVYTPGTGIVPNMIPVSFNSTYHGREEVLEVERLVSSGVPFPVIPIRDPARLKTVANVLSLLAASAARTDFRPIIRY